MPQPDEVTRRADRLIAVYVEAQSSMQARFEEIARDENRWRERRRLRELLASIDAEIDRLQQATRQWIQLELPLVYGAGAQTAADTVGTSFAWTQSHREAIQELAERVWDELLEATDYVRADTKRTIRTLARNATRRALLENATRRALLESVTASKAGDELAQAIRTQTGIGTVRYRNGARHSLRDHADTVTRTETALAYNRGTFTQAREDGFEWMEVFDGTACGWTSHDSGDLANGTVRLLEDCIAQPLSHPRCARSFAPRPDVTNARAAKAAQLGTDAERQAAAALEREREAAQPVRFSVARQRQLEQRRTARTARRAREPRTPRRADASDV